MYCDDKNDLHRRGAQTAMAIIAKKLFSTIACILTYTVDELLTHSPEVIKGNAQDVFDLNTYEIPNVTNSLNNEVLMGAKEKFQEAIDKLKKEKIIKSTLELDIYTNSKDLLVLPKTEIADWFIVSNCIEKSQNPLLRFELDGAIFEAYKASKQKCPRCWKFTSVSSECLCIRCEDAVK